ncbi:ribonuclease H-like domain-containing protein [Tanacetum coccineum]|uniref:Ribonuclease H-like domain-containing protein n=1 Tax=Tanacetum coccineum TaxID=301880 RepID=A0ABQ4XD84_9ASTR
MKKKGKLNITAKLVPKDFISDDFIAWMMPKEIWAAIKNKVRTFKRHHLLLSHQTMVAFSSQAKASSSKHKPSHSTGSYGSYTTSSSKPTTTATPGLVDEVIHSFLAINSDDVDLIHEDLDQIDDLDLEEMDINWQIAMTAIKIKKFYKKTGRRPRVDGKMHVAFDKRKVECFNCHNTGHFARECKFKSSKDGSRQEAGRGQDFKPVRTKKEALMTIDEGQINWVEQTEDKELNHALMAFTVNNEKKKLVLTAISVDEKLKKYRRIGMKAVKDKDALQKIVDSWFASSKNLWKLVDCGMSSTVKIGYNDIPLYSRFKQVEYKGVPHPLSGDYTPREQEDIDDSCDGERLELCLQILNCLLILSIHDSDEGNKETDIRTIQSLMTLPIHLSIEQFTNRSSFERKPCFVCGSLSHLIKDCDYYEKKMAREAAIKRRRVVNTNDRQATPAWNNTNRINKANQFTPRPVNVRPNLSTASNTIKTGRVNVNTGHGNVNSDSMHVNAGTQFKSGYSRLNTGKQHVSSGSVYVNSVTHFKSAATRVNTGKRYINSGCVHINTARVNRPMFNKPNPKPSQGSTRQDPSYEGLGPKEYYLFLAHLEDYQELSKVGSVTFGGSKGSISGKGTIRLELFCGVLDFRADEKSVLLKSSLATQHVYLFDMKTVPLLEAAGYASDSLLPTTFGAKMRCKYACYTSTGPLGKFDGKSDEGFLVGYSVNSKAFRVYNLVTKESGKTEEAEELLVVSLLLGPAAKELDALALKLLGTVRHQFLQSTDPVNTVLKMKTKSSLMDFEDDDAYEIQLTKEAFIKGQQTLSLLLAFYLSFEPRTSDEALEDGAWVEAMQERTCGRKQEGRERCSFRNKALACGSGHRQEEGIDYDEMGDLTFFSLQVKLNNDGIFPSSGHKYVADMLKKFDLVYVNSLPSLHGDQDAFNKMRKAIDVDDTVQIYDSILRYVDLLVVPTLSGKPQQVVVNFLSEAVQLGMERKGAGVTRGFGLNLVAGGQELKTLEKELSETKQTLWQQQSCKPDRESQSYETVKKKRKSKETKDAEDQDQEVPFETDQGDTFVTPEKSKGSGEAQEEQISPSTLEAAQILTIVASEGFKGSQAPLAHVNTALERVQRRKGKEPMTEEDLQAEVQASKTSKELQELADLEEAKRVQAEMDVETQRQIDLDALLARRLVEQEEEAAREALATEFDYIQARLNADQILAEKIQQEEREQYSIEERAKFLHDTIAAQRKFLAEQRSAIIRNKPPTISQLRNQMITYLKHVANKKHAELKSKSFEEIQVLYERYKKQDQTFVAIGSEEDERAIKRINEKDADKEEEKKDESVHEEVHEEVQEEEGAKKRKLGTRRKLKAKRRKHGSSLTREDDDLKICLHIVLKNWKFQAGNYKFLSGVHTIMTKVLGLVFHIACGKEIPLDKGLVLSQMLELMLETEEKAIWLLELIKFVKQQLEEFGRILMMMTQSHLLMKMKKGFECWLTTTQQMVLGSPCLTDIRSILVLRCKRMFVKTIKSRS